MRITLRTREVLTPPHVHGAIRGVKRQRTTAMASGPREIAGKHVAVVGASRGIGLEFVRQLLARGNSVHATARSPGESEGLQELKKSSSDLSLATLDTGDAKSIEKWATQLGGQSQFQYLFNIAGIADPTRSGLDTIDADKMIKCFQVNAIGPLLIVKQLLEAGLLSKGSTVVNLTSKVGSIADNQSGSSYAYRASKTALNAVTKSMSIDLQSRGITCLVLHPGWVRTDMTRGKGLIDVDQSVKGLLSVLESDLPLNGQFYDYKHEAIPW